MNTHPHTRGSEHTPTHQRKYTHPHTRGSEHTPTHQRKYTQGWLKKSEHSNPRRHQKASILSRVRHFIYIRTYVHICMHIRVYACLLNIRMYILSYIDMCLEMATPITVLQTVLLLLPLCCCGLSMVGPVCHCMMSLTQKVCSFLACPCICLYLHSHTATAVCVNNVLLLTQPLSTAQGLHLTPDNIEYWATFLDSSASIQDRVIHFGSGAANASSGGASWTD